LLTTSSSPPDGSFETGQEQASARNQEGERQRYVAKGLPGDVFEIYDQVTRGDLVANGRSSDSARSGASKRPGDTIWPTGAREAGSVVRDYAGA
jgi:hypothetical protein